MQVVIPTPTFPPQVSLTVETEAFTGVNQVRRSLGRSVALMSGDRVVSEEVILAPTETFTVTDAMNGMLAVSNGALNVVVNTFPLTMSAIMVLDMPIVAGTTFTNASSTDTVTLHLSYVVISSASSTPATSLTVQQDGTQVLANVSVLNFEGNLHATSGGSGIIDVSVTIPSTTPSPPLFDLQTVGALNEGPTTDITTDLNLTPMASQVAYVMVFRNGVLQQENNVFVVAGPHTLRFFNADVATDDEICIYSFTPGLAV